MVDKADEELAAGNTGELLATLAPLLLETPSLNERSTAAAALADAASKTDSEQQMVALTSAQRSEALGVLAEAARAEAVKALRGNKPDSIARADRALAVEVRARGALFYAAAKFLTPESMAEGDVERDPHAITDALPNLIACLRGVVELRGHGALAPEGGVGFNRRESIDGLEGEAATRRREARVAVASFAPVFAKMIAAYYAKKAHHPPGEVPKERVQLCVCS